MPAVMVVLTVGILIIVPWMTFLSSSIDQIQEDTVGEEAYYAAEAGIEAVIKDLALGLDALDVGYTIPSVTVNGISATITISQPPGDDSLLFGPTLVDPESSTSLLVLGPEVSFQYLLPNVRTNTPLEINWAFAPDTDWELAVFEGAGALGPQVLDASGSISPANGIVPGNLVTGGVYTIRFTNASEEDVILTSGFSNTGASTGTWMKVSAFKSYLISSSAGGETLTALARQGPGPTQAQRSVQVSSRQDT